MAAVAVAVAQWTREFRDVRGQRMIAVAGTSRRHPSSGTLTPIHSPRGLP
jgi:hypothetical protein